MIKIIKKILTILVLFFISVKLILVTAIFLYPNIISSYNIEANAKELIDLTNQYRESQGLTILSPNPRLTQAAVNKAYDLLTNQYFSHTSPDGKKFSDWIKEVDYKYFYVGENLAIDFEKNDDIFQAWLESPSHKENIIKPQYQEIGIAVIEGKYKNSQTTVVVQLFGSRVLGENDSINTFGSINNFADNYLSTNNFWIKKASLKNIEKLNNLTNYFLLITLGLYLITYTPVVKKKNQINIKQPIVNRYQAKIFRE